MGGKMIVAAAVAALLGVAGLAAARQEGPPAAPAGEEGFVSLIPKQEDGRYAAPGWRHHGPGSFTLDEETGELQSHGGMGLHWYAARAFSDFVLELEYKTSKPDSNSGIFLRVPAPLQGDDYIYESFEVQIHDTATDPIHRTGGVYDAEAPSHVPSRGPGEWNRMRISFVGSRITVHVNGEPVVDWQAEPRGKVRSFADSGHIGLQNHDRDSSVWFRNVRVKDLAAES